MTPFHYEVSRLRQTPNPLEVEVVSRTRRLIAVALATVALGATVAAPVAASSPQPQAIVAKGPLWCC
jgi:hypothetical protein